MHFDNATPLNSDLGSSTRLCLDCRRLSVDAASNAQVGNICDCCPGKALRVIEAPFDTFGSQSRVESCIASWIAKRSLKIDKFKQQGSLESIIRIGINVNVPYCTMGRNEARKEHGGVLK